MVKIKYLGMGNFQVVETGRIIKYRQGNVYNAGLKAGQYRAVSEFIRDYMVNNHHGKKYPLVELVR